MKVFAFFLILLALYCLTAFVITGAGSLPVVHGESQLSVPETVLLDPQVFDSSFYLNYHGDLRKLSVEKNWNESDAVRHYLKHGVSEGRQGSPFFAVKEYRVLYEDSAALDYARAIEHYLRVGIKEKRAGRLVLAPEVFSVLAYKAFNPDISKLNAEQAVTHWLDVGIKEGRRASVQFSAKDYAARYPGLISTIKGSAAVSDHYHLIAHYMLKGRRESRLGHQALLPAEWYSLHAGDKISPVTVEPGDRVRSFTGADGALVKVVVKQPKLPENPRVVTLDFDRTTSAIERIPDGADAYAPFAALFAEVAKAKKMGQPYNIIDIPKGSYDFKSGESAGAYFNIFNLEDVVIRGNGSKLVFHDLGKNGLRIHNSRRLRIEGLELEWEGTLAVLGSMKKESGENYLVLNPKTGSIADNMFIDQVALYDPDKQSWAGKIEFDFSESRMLAKDSAGRYYDPVFTTLFHDSDAVIARLRARDFFPNGIVFPKSDLAMSEDITLSGLVLRNVPGMAIVASYVDRGLLIEDSRIEKQDKALISASKDGIHLGNVSGDIIIEGNDVGFQGDDGINITPHSVRVTELDGNFVTVKRTSGDQLVIRVGDEIAFVNEGMGYLGKGSVLKVIKATKESVQVELSSVPDGVVAAESGNTRSLRGSFARNITRTPRRVYVGFNAFHDNRGRAMVVKVANALYENNDISNTTAAGILLTSDELSTFGYFEGHGVNNVVIRNNTIADVGRGARFVENTPAISLVGAVDSGTGSVIAAQYPVIQKVVLEGNKIVRPQGPCMIIASTLDIRITNNSCLNASLSKRSGFIGSKTLNHPVIILNSRGISLNNNNFGTEGSISMDPLSVAQ